MGRTRTALSHGQVHKKNGIKFGLRAESDLLEGLVDDGALDVLDGHRVLNDAQHAGALARSCNKQEGMLGWHVNKSRFFLRARYRALGSWFDVVPPLNENNALNIQFRFRNKDGSDCE